MYGTLILCGIISISSLVLNIVCNVEFIFIDTDK